jgi:hypothetical protein
VSAETSRSSCILSWSSPSFPTAPIAALETAPHARRRAASLCDRNEEKECAALAALAPTGVLKGRRKAAMGVGQRHRETGERGPIQTGVLVHALPERSRHGLRDRTPGRVLEAKDALVVADIGGLGGAGIGRVMAGGCGWPSLQPTEVPNGVALGENGGAGWGPIASLLTNRLRLGGQDQSHDHPRQLPRLAFPRLSPRRFLRCEPLYPYSLDYWRTYASLRRVRVKSSTARGVSPAFAALQAGRSPSPRAPALRRSLDAMTVAIEAA